jgi:phosphoglycerate dehydrogenase-like enzyme
MKLLILNREAEYIRDALKPDFPDLTIHAASNESEIGNFISETDILMAVSVSDELISKAAGLQWIQSLISGVDYLITLPSLRKDVLVSSCRGIHGPQMSEIAFLLMLSLNRGFVKNIENQKQKVWDRWPTKLLYKKKVGILGVGIIGKEIARKCKAFEMTVHGITSVKRETEFVDFPHGPDELKEVLSEVDYFICMVPSSAQTKKMIGAEELAAMKSSAYFISMGRGDTIDEDALIHVLKNKKIAGAGLDVFDKEPLPSDSPLWEMDNVIITPHIGGMSDIYSDQILPILRENLSRFLKGERRDLINFIEWQK